MARDEHAQLCCLGSFLYRPVMSRKTAGRISLVLFFLALVEVWAWSLPMVHSAVGGSAQDLQAYFSRETANTAQIDSHRIDNQDFTQQGIDGSNMKRDSTNQEAEYMSAEEQARLAELESQMSLGFIVR